MKPTNAHTLFNSDCNFFSAEIHSGPGRFTTQFFYDYCARLGKSGVDAVLVNFNGQQPWYPSKRVDHMLKGYTRGDHSFVKGHFPPTNNTDFTEADLVDRCKSFCWMLDRFVDMTEDGKDWLAEYSKAARKAKVQPWLSMRMNDMHGMNSWEGSMMNCDIQKNPKYRLPGRELNPKDGLVYGLGCMDYKHKQVRDYMLEVLAEPVEDYDYEGIELDWMRSPFAFDPLESKKHLPKMIDFMEKVRAITNARGKKNKKPYPVGLRSTGRFLQMKAHGIDVIDLAKRGLIDFVVVGNFWHGNWDIPFDELKKQLGDNVALYGCIDASPNALITGPDTKKTPAGIRYTPLCPPLARGQAASKMALGCDGVEYFNYFVTPDGDGMYDTIKECKSLKVLAGKPKQYCQSQANGFYEFPWLEFAQALPATLPWMRKTSLRFGMAKETGKFKMKVQVILLREDQTPDIGVSFNGAWPTFKSKETTKLLFPAAERKTHIDKHRVLEFIIDSPEIFHGWNELIIINGGAVLSTLPTHTGPTVNIQMAEISIEPQ
jgi:hypothetical protein